MEIILFEMPFIVFFPKHLLFYGMGKFLTNQTLPLRVSLKIQLNISWRTAVNITV